VFTQTDVTRECKPFRPHHILERLLYNIGADFQNGSMAYPPLVSASN
jgi:hypothetical protein